jgi:phenylacetate-CoA ligase
MILMRYFNGYVLFPMLEKKSKRQITSKLNELRRFAALSLNERDELRRREMHRSLVHAREKVPYYTDLFRAIAFDPEKILKDLRFVQDLPVLTKEIVKANTDRLRLSAACHPRKTGGSTGQSVLFYYDNVGLDWTSALNLRAYEMIGKVPHLNDAHISSEIGVGPSTPREKFFDWLKLFSQNRSRLMIRSFSDEDLYLCFRSLKARRPFLLQGHPSSGYAIANYIERHGLQGPRYCAVFEPSGETLTQKMADTMERNFRCKVTNRYGNAEFGVMAHSRIDDPFTTLRVFDRAFYMEPTVKGNLIVSTWTNDSFPLFRYDTGDVGTVTETPEGTVLSEIHGRIHDVVRINNEDYATHYIMDYLDHKIRRVREFQILVGAKSPLLTIVPEDVNDMSRIKSEVLARWPSGLDVDFVRFDQLKRVGWQNKFRHVIQQEQPTGPAQ